MPRRRVSVSTRNGDKTYYDHEHVRQRWEVRSVAVEVDRLVDSQQEKPPVELATFWSRWQGQDKMKAKEAAKAEQVKASRANTIAWPAVVVDVGK